MYSNLTGVLILIVLLIVAYYFITKYTGITKNTSNRNTNYTIEDKYNEEKITKQKRIDTILDKISKKGYVLLPIL